MVRIMIMIICLPRCDIIITGTTIATNAILEGKGATVALLVTEGYKDILQVRRSYVPGGLAGWYIPFVQMLRSYLTIASAGSPGLNRSLLLLLN